MIARILLADDEPDIVEPLVYALQQASYEVESVGDGASALEAARRGSFELVLLDVVMPSMSGTDVCRVLRSESDVPIIMLTARDAELDRVVGLELGADDYITKPFSTRELLSRIRAVLRRRELDLRSRGGPICRVGGLSIDLSRHTVEADGRQVRLTPFEFKLLVLLAEEPDRVFTRAQIMETLWQTPYVGQARACDVHISNLRRKIERDATNPERIVTVREYGYKLVAVG